MFISHYIAEWLGIPAGIVIAAMIILRRQGRALRARRQQVRAGHIAEPDAGDVTVSATDRGRSHAP
jgi:hypothetical protein